MKIVFVQNHCTQPVTINTDAKSCLGFEVLPLVQPKLEVALSPLAKDVIDTDVDLVLSNPVQLEGKNSIPVLMIQMTTIRLSLSWRCPLLLSRKPVLRLRMMDLSCRTLTKLTRFILKVVHHW